MDFGYTLYTKALSSIGNLLCSPILLPLLLHTSHCDTSELTSGFLDTIKKTLMFLMRKLFIHAK